MADTSIAARLRERMTAAITERAEIAARRIADDQRDAELASRIAEYREILGEPESDNPDGAKRKRATKVEQERRIGVIVATIQEAARRLKLAEIEEGMRIRLPEDALPARAIGDIVRRNPNVFVSHDEGWGLAINGQEDPFK